MRQPKLLRMIKLYKMTQPCCYTLNQSDGNSSVTTSVRPISDDAAGTSWAGRPETPPLFESAWWHFQMSGSGVLVGMDRDYVLKFLKEFKMMATLQKTL